MKTSLVSLLVLLGAVASVTAKSFLTSSEEDELSGSEEFAHLEPVPYMERLTVYPFSGNKIHFPTTGDKCNPDDCTVAGYCKTYYWCKRTIDPASLPSGDKGNFAVFNCSDGLYFEPAVHKDEVGSCVEFHHLKPETKDLYNKDPSCSGTVPCDFKEDAPCSSKYHFYLTRQPAMAIQWTSAKCSSTLIWNQQKRTCDWCKNVTNSKTGLPCNCPQ